MGIAADVAPAPAPAPVLARVPVAVPAAVPAPLAEEPAFTDVGEAADELTPAEGFTDYIGALENMYGGMEVADDDGGAPDESYLGIVDDGGAGAEESQEAWEAEFQRKRESNRRRLEAEAEAEALQLYGDDAVRDGAVLDGNSLNGEALEALFAPGEGGAPSEFQELRDAKKEEQAGGADDEAIDFNNSDFADWLGSQPAHFHPAGP